MSLKGRPIKRAFCARALAGEALPAHLYDFKAGITSYHKLCMAANCACTCGHPRLPKGMTGRALQDTPQGGNGKN